MELKYRLVLKSEKNLVMKGIAKVRHVLACLQCRGNCVTKKKNGGLSHKRLTSPNRAFSSSKNLVTKGIAKVRHVLACPQRRGNCVTKKKNVLTCYD
eukprot:sb/3478960/